MKGIACGRCYDVRTLPNMQPVDATVECRCGNLRGRWVDANAGTAEYAALDRTLGFGIGFNNQFLIPALAGGTAMHSDARALHERATDAPGYVFDKARAGCWAIIFKPGATTDTAWVDWYAW